MCEQDLLSGDNDTSIFHAVVGTIYGKNPLGVWEWSWIVACGLTLLDPARVREAMSLHTNRHTLHLICHTIRSRESNVQGSTFGMQYAGNLHVCSFSKLHRLMPLALSRAPFKQPVRMYRSNPSPPPHDPHPSSFPRADYSFFHLPSYPTLIEEKMISSAKHRIGLPIYKKTLLCAYIYIYIYIHLHIYIYIYVYICTDIRHPPSPEPSPLPPSDGPWPTHSGYGQICSDGLDPWRILHQTCLVCIFFNILFNCVEYNKY